MNSKMIVGVVVGIVVVLVVVAWMLLVGGGYNFGRGEQAATQKVSSGGGAATGESLGVSESVTVETTGKTAPTVEITGAGFSPSTLTVGKGDTVTFVNEGSSPARPASANHPTHTVYPTTGGCIGSTFDACRGLAQGDSWSFIFDEAGTWAYHDHLNPTHFGSITVQ